MPTLKTAWRIASRGLLAAATLSLISCAGATVKPVVVCPPLIAWPPAEQQALGDALAAEVEAAALEARPTAPWFDPTLAAARVLVDQRAVVKACAAD